VSAITKLGMPKWGLSMTQGRLIDWLVEEGAKVTTGDGLAEVETEKINGEIEAPAPGVLRRRVAQAGEVIPVGGLVGVIAEPDVSDEDIDAFIAEFQATFVPGEEAEAGPQPETAEVGGRRLRYLRLGEEADAVPALLLHGFGGDLDNWLFNQQALAEGRRVYALDLPGHGQSSKHVGAGDLDGLVAVVEGFLEAVGVERVHLAGHSLGGAIAIAYASAHPERVASVTLLASAGLGEEINPAYIEGFIAEDRRRGLKPVLGLLFADESLVSRQMVDDVLRYKRLDGVPEALRTLAERLFPAGRQTTVLRPRLAELDVPVLVIWGREDRIVPLEHTERLPDNVRLEVLDATGHSPHMERAGDVNRLLMDFWRQR
jgi:pyruvate dehydrogenase E2 component (dihydrolipoamide acetyltransferase)